jgi:protein-S-isoprenylcysteine O-methyltransferase Ste14
VLKVRGESLEQLGLSKQRWLPSLLISLVLVVRLIPRIFELLKIIPPDLVLPTIIFNGLCLWEPFFVYCWIQLRFERAFGVIPGILAAGLCLGSYHIGTYPWEMVIVLGMIGIFFGVVFRLTRNLLILWPLTWTVASTMGTVLGGFTFGWNPVWIYTIILLMQGTGILWISRSQQNRNEPKHARVIDLEESKTYVSWREWIPSYIFSAILIFQILFTFFTYASLRNETLVNVGWGIMTISAIFGWIPIITFRKKGGVSKGKSYIQTKILVDSGIYAIVRHPQYLAGILMSLALVFLSQHWLIAILFIPVTLCIYGDSFRADRNLVKKFGDKYENYMDDVSGLNPLKGILRKWER